MILFEPNYYYDKIVYIEDIIYTYNDIEFHFIKEESTKIEYN